MLQERERDHYRCHRRKRQTLTVIDVKMERVSDGDDTRWLIALLEERERVVDAAKGRERCQGKETG